tara:strand:+ start:288 stop:488 length:201 start_codon:yes stop_codon:yes gene_type:complete
MKWILKLFGMKTSLEKKQDKLAALRKSAFDAQRKGKLSLAGKYLHEAEMLETEIADEMEVDNGREG